jgi:hemerythrin
LYKINNEQIDQEHKQLHDRIITQMNDFVTKIAKMDPAATEQKLIEYMDVWLVQHIIIEDRKITCYKHKIS